MTWRDLIIYILENNLEDKPVFENGKISGFMTISEAAAKFGVGEPTIAVWIKFGWLDIVTVGKTTFIPINTKNPMEVTSSNNIGGNNV